MKWDREGGYDAEDKTIALVALHINISFPDVTPSLVRIEVVHRSCMCCATPHIEIGTYHTYDLTGDSGVEPRDLSTSNDYQCQNLNCYKATVKFANR
jgi:hypothetical protein